MKITTTLLLGAFSVLALATVPACDDKKDDKKAEDKKDAKATDKKAEPAADAKKDAAPAPAADAPPAGDAAPAGDAPAGGADKIGIPECDEYIEKYTKCIMDKVPEAAQAQMKDAMNQSAKAWKEAAAGPAKDGVAATCKTALDAAKTATSAMGCEW